MGKWKFIGKTGNNPTFGISEEIISRMSALVKKPGKKLNKVPRFGVMPSVPQKLKTKPTRHQKHRKKDVE